MLILIVFGTSILLLGVLINKLLFMDKYFVGLLVAFKLKLNNLYISDLFISVAVSWDNLYELNRACYYC